MSTDQIPSLVEAYYLIEWLIRIVMLGVVPFRRTAAASTSWLLLVFFLPIPGLLLFLAIGSPRFPKWRTARFESLHPGFAELSARLTNTAPSAGESERGIAPVAQRLGHFPLVGGNAIHFIEDYDGLIDRLAEDIDAARSRVRLLVYIFADDAAGSKVIAALGRAVARGVPCHVLIDSVGSHRWLRGTLRLLKEAGVQVRAALPFHWLRGRTRRDMRNHRKLFLIDGAIGYAGSQNIVAKDFRPGVTNRELTVRVTGPVVAELDAVFVADWYLETERVLDATPSIPTAPGTAALQVLPSGANYPLEGFQTLLVWQIHQAIKRVIVVTPYLIPDEGLLGAFRTAAVRGVRIDLIVSAIADQKLVSLAQSSYYDELLTSGVNLYRFPDYLLHAKSVSIDDHLGIVGSSNVDVRSFQLNEEVSLLLFDRPSIAELQAIQEGYIARSGTPLPLDEWRQRGPARKLVENAARLVSPLL